MNKTAHAEWLKQLDSALMAAGATKEIHPPRSEKHVAIPHYTVTTKAGPLVLHPDIPWRLNKGQRLSYNCTVFGKFSDMEAGQALTGHWKWNTHYGSRLGFEIPEVVRDFAYRLACIR